MKEKEKEKLNEINDENKKNECCVCCGGVGVCFMFVGKRRVSNLTVFFI